MCEKKERDDIKGKNIEEYDESGKKSVCKKKVDFIMESRD